MRSGRRSPNHRLSTRPKAFQSIGLRRLGEGRRACRRDRISFFGAVECALFNTDFEFLRNGDAMDNLATRLFFGPRQNDVSKLKNVFGGVDHYVLYR
jgi:hypothetical protein